MTRNEVAVTGLLALLATLFVANGATAQSPEDPPPRLTLEEAVRRAGIHNPTFRRTVNSLELNSIENRDFWLGFLPQPSLNFLSTNMQWNRTTVAEDVFGDPVANPESRMIQSATSSQSAVLAFRLDPQDYFRRRDNRFQADQRLVEVTRVERDLASDIRMDFLEAQERQAFYELEAGLLDIRRIHHEMTEQRFRLAQVDRPDLLDAELDLVEQENALEQSRADLRTALLALRNRIGDPSLTDFEVEPIPVRLFDPAGLDPEAVVSAALESDSRMGDERFQLSIAEREASAQRADWLPTLRVDASTSRQAFSRESANAFFQPLPDGDWGRSIRLTLSFPDLGQYFLRRNTYDRTWLDIRNASESLREAQLQVEEDARTQLLELDNQYRTVALQERRVALAEERLELQDDRYRLGIIDYLELQTATETLSNARRQLLQARYAFERGRIQLERSLGSELGPSAPGSDGN